MGQPGGLALAESKTPLPDQRHAQSRSRICEWPSIYDLRQGTIRILLRSRAEAQRPRQRRRGLALEPGFSRPQHRAAVQGSDERVTNDTSLTRKRRTGIHWLAALSFARASGWCLMQSQGNQLCVDLASP